MKLIRVWLFGFLFVSVFAHSDDIGLDANIAKYVSVTFQVQGLNESTNALKEAMTSLSFYDEKNQQVASKTDC